MFTHSAISAKNLVIASTKANKNLATLGAVLENNGEVLINAAENSWEYYGALETVAEAAKRVFGDKVDPSFVSTHKHLFADLAKGGEIAQNALKQLSEYYTKEFLKDGDINFDQVKAALNGIFEGVDPGAAIDLKGYYENLMKIEGMTEATAKNILQSWGFTVMTSKEWLTDNAGNVINGSIAGVRVDAN
jgi:hypothetical protein